MSIYIKIMNNNIEKLNENISLLSEALMLAQNTIKEDEDKKEKLKNLNSVLIKENLTYRSKLKKIYSYLSNKKNDIDNNDKNDKNDKKDDEELQTILKDLKEIIIDNNTIECMLIKYMDDIKKIGT
jgi:hypothetical protein